MAVRFNEDKEIVQMVKDGLKRTGGYCPLIDAPPLPEDAPVVNPSMEL